MLPADHPDLAVSNNNLASTLIATGRYSDSIHVYETILKRCRESGPRTAGLRATTLLNLAVAYRSQGQYEQAIEYCREALRLHEQVFGAETLGSVVYFNALASLNRALGNYEQSFDESARSIEICRKCGRPDHQAAAMAHFNMGVLAQIAKAFDSAESHWERALKIHERLGEWPLVARTLNALGILAYEQKDLTRATALFRRVLSLEATAQLRPQELYGARCNLALALRAASGADIQRRGEARTILDEAIKQIETTRGWTSDSEFERAEYFDRFSSAFDMLVEWSFEDGDTDAAFLAAERARNRTFLDQLHLAGVDLRDTLVDERGQAMIAIRDRNFGTSSGTTSETKLAQSKNDSIRSDSDSNEIRRGLRRQQSKSRPGHNILVSLAEVLLPTHVRTIVEERKVARLIVVPDGALHSLPFEALVLSHDSSSGTFEFVLDRLPPIAYVPSVNILLNLKRRAAAPETARAQLLTVGNPAYDRNVQMPNGLGSVAPSQPKLVASQFRSVTPGITGQLPLLPGTEHECNLVESYFQKASKKVIKLLANDATEKNVMRQISGKGFIHFAAHGIVDEQEQNLFGAIALTPPSENSSDEDGFLSYNEILRLPLHGCEIAVLSACETNVGAEVKMEAASSLARAFVAAGSRRVIASHWSVNDDSTAQLTSEFFRRALESGSADRKMDFAAALHQARIAVRKDSRWTAPFYWAPFVLIGPPQGD